MTSLQDKVAKRERLLAEVKQKLEEFRLSGKTVRLKSTIPLESRSIRQLEELLRCWRRDEHPASPPQAMPEPQEDSGRALQELPTPKQSESESDQPTKVMRIGRTQMQAAFERLRSNRCSNQEQHK